MLLFHDLTQFNLYKSIENFRFRKVYQMSRVPFKTF